MWATIAPVLRALCVVLAIGVISASSVPTLGAKRGALEPKKSDKKSKRTGKPLLSNKFRKSLPPRVDEENSDEDDDGSSGWGWTGVVLGAGATVVGGVFLASAFSDRSEANAQLDPGEKETLQASYRDKRNVGAIVGGSGLLLVALGIWALNGSDSDRQFSLAASADSATLAWVHRF